MLDDARPKVSHRAMTIQFLDPHLEDFLRTTTQGVLSTLSSTGLIHSVPVNFTQLPKDGEIWVLTSGDSNKVQNLKATPTASLCVHEGRRYYYVAGDAWADSERVTLELAESIFEQKYHRSPRLNPKRVVVRLKMDHVVSRGF